MTTDYIMALQGRVNRYSDTPCQDFVARKRRKGVTALALCDGAGSLKFSEIGARRIAETFVDWASDRFYALLQQSDEVVVTTAVGLIQTTLATLEVDYEAPAREFGSTLLLLAYDTFGRHFVLHLGDGIIVGLQPSGELFIVSAPEGIGNATYLTNCKEELLQDHIRVYRPRNITGLFASSDGAKRLLYEGEGKRAVVSPEIGSLLQKMRNNRSGFAVGFPAFVDQAVKPLDDFSVAMVMHDVSAAYGMIYHRGDNLHKRRVAQGYGRYMDALRSGVSRSDACRKAGWRKKHWARRMKYAETIFR